MEKFRRICGEIVGFATIIGSIWLMASQQQLWSSIVGVVTLAFILPFIIYPLFGIHYDDDELPPIV